MTLTDAGGREVLLDAAGYLRNGDLFVRQLRQATDHRVLQVRENFLTESFAGALRESVALRRRLLVLLNGGRRRWGRRPIATIRVDVEPCRAQYRLPSGALCYPDLVMTVAGVHRVGVEIKIGAPLGVGASGKGQLESYLGLKELTNVALLTGYHTPVPKAAIAASGRYLRPDTRDHFLWADLYDDVAELAHRPGSSVLTRALLGLLEYLKFQPFDNVVGDLGGFARHSDVSQEIRDRRAAMAARLEPLLGELRESDYDPSRVRNNGEFYVNVPGRAPWLLWVDPRLVPGMFRLAVRCFLPNAHRNQRAVVAALRALPWPRGTVIDGEQMPEHPYATILIPYATLLTGVRSDAGVNARLHRAVSAVLQVAAQVVGPPLRPPQPQVRMPSKP